ncbi:inositol monophosphatase family protein [Actinospica robiniae]|uniref:inositol monophosphatase family protein n=1 Tax=Actinospica robiniae TaxID=304901 RepID=UPI00054EAE5E|nr:inositol monophosphatase family protein [Actinospica robiniae]
MSDVGAPTTTADELWTYLNAQLVPAFSRYRERINELPVEVKADKTLLTEADIAVQKSIIEAIRAMEPSAVVIAEEDERTHIRTEVLEASGRVWVVDPIDGTAEFVRGDRVEFCSVVCLLEDWQPSAAFILAPELGEGRTSIVVTADVASKRVMVNGVPLSPQESFDDSKWLSITRSEGLPARAVDPIAEAAGYRLKTRTTSQTLDMVRTAIDISGLTDPTLPRFSLFCRREQKLWDGVAGLALGRASGLRDCDEAGAPLPLNAQFLSTATPVFSSTVMGSPETVAWFLEAAGR